MTAEVVWILDTSVAAAWFFDDDDQHDDANRVLAGLRARPDDFAVPELFYSELVHVLARKSGRDAGFVHEALTALLDLGLRTFPLSQPALRRAAELACGPLSGYDATFVALAEEQGARWLSADARAAGASGAISHSLRAFPAVDA